MSGQHINAPGKPCARCNTEPRLRGSYCRGCTNALERECRKRRRAGTQREWHNGCAPDCSTPPPPPEGFDARDLRNGIPYGSVHAADSHWQDGTRPAGFHVQTIGALLPWT